MRRPLIEQYRRSWGMAPSMQRIADDVRELQLSPRTGDLTQNIYSVSGGGGGGGGSGASAHGDIDTTGMKQPIWAGGFRPTTTGGCESPKQYEFGTNDVDEIVSAFDASTQEYGWTQIAMPDNWDGSTLTAKVYWTPRTDGTNDMTSGTVRWGVQLLAIGNSDAIDQAWGTAQEVNDAFDADSELHISDETAAITAGGSPAPGDLLKVRVYREAADGADTGNGDAWLIGVSFEYGITALSS